MGKWLPVAWNPFSSVTQLTMRAMPSGERKEYDPRETPISSGLGSTCFWDPDSSTMVPSSLSKLFNVNDT